MLRHGGFLSHGCIFGTSFFFDFEWLVLVADHELRRGLLLLIIGHIFGCLDLVNLPFF